MLVTKILEKLPQDWQEQDLETVLQHLREQAAKAIAAEQLASATGKKVRTKAPTFTKNRQVVAELPEELKNLEIDL